MSSYTQPQWPTWAYTPEVNDPFSGYPQYNNYSSYLADSMEAYQTHHHHHLVHNHQMSRTTEAKPRLSKEEVELLEAEFQKNHKPNSTVKKGLAESMRVDNARINVSDFLRLRIPRRSHMILVLTLFVLELVPEPTCSREEGEEHSRI
jgi:hypothetical protein